MSALSQAEGRRLYGKAGWQAAQDTEFWFGEVLRQPNGAPFAPYDWQCKDILYPIFGTLDASGLRRIQTAYIEIAKKNGKSLIGAGVALKLLVADGELGAHVVSAAASKEQAKIVFGEAVRMVESSPYLSKLCQVYRNEIRGPHGGKYEAISADAPTKHGPSYSGIIFDEVHTQPNRNLWDTITAGIVARDQGLVFAITTAGSKKTGLCWDLHKRALKSMADPKSDPTFYGKIYEFDESKYAWDSEEAFASVNPSYPRSIKRRVWEGMIATARQTELDEANYRQLHLNQWLDSAITAWIPADIFALCA